MIASSKCVKSEEELLNDLMRFKKQKSKQLLENGELINWHTLNFD